MISSALPRNESRLDFNNRKMKVFEGAQRKTFQVDVLTIIIAFLVILSGMGFSYFLIIEDMKIIGTIFGGATVFFAANSFLNFRKRQRIIQGKQEMVCTYFFYK